MIGAASSEPLIAESAEQLSDFQRHLVSSSRGERDDAASRFILPWVEDRATDTLQSVLFCDALLRQRDDIEYIVPCSSSYHNLRCAVLLRILGYPVRQGRMPPDLRHLGAWKWSRYVFKEMLALPYDATLLWLRDRWMAVRRNA